MVETISNAVHLIVTYIAQGIAIVYLCGAFSALLMLDHRDPERWQRGMLRAIVLALTSIACAVLCIASVTLYGK